MNASATPLMDERNRILCFEGACNFRDVGGYLTQEGRVVRWAMVYRTGVLSYFTGQDHASLMELGVRAICDLRRAEEREREPTRWPDAAARSLFFSDGDATPTIRALSAGKPSTAGGMFDAMVELYRILPAWMGERIGGMFECLATDHAPLIVHCAAGKDRTGVAVAVLLSALGVPREVVIEDYLLTNEAGDFERFIRSRHAAQLGLADEHHPLLAMPADVRKVLFSADPAFLEAAFDAIDELGGLERYLERTARVSPESLERVRAVMLES
jgi:protein-tyrosine phosphatase